MTEAAEPLPAIDPAPRTKSLTMRLLTWTICLVVLAFVAWALVRQFRQVPWAEVQWRALPAAAAIACIAGVSAMQLLARWTLLIAYGYPLRWRVQLAAAWVPQLGKYVPGGIASIGGAVYLLRRHGVPAAVGLSVAVLLDALAVMAGLIVSMPLLLWEPVRTRMPMAWLAAIVLMVAGLVILYPPVFIAMLNFALQRLRRQPITHKPALAKFLWPVLASFGQWLLAGLGLWFMTAAVTDVTLSLIPLFVASAALAMTVSYLTPFAPGGIGIREGLYLLTLGPVIGPRVAIVVVAMRIVQTIMEVVLAGVGGWVLRSHARR